MSFYPAGLEQYMYLILQKTFEIPSFKRDHDKVFESISKILYRYGLKENNRNLRFRFILCKQEFFDSIPQEKWKLKDSQHINNLGNSQ